MSYENAPGTKLLATLCACCARPLLDAASVEAGMGPHCRAKHGYKKADVEPNWDRLAALVRQTVSLSETELFGGSPAVAEATWRLGGLETRRVANVIVHRIAVHQTGPDVLLLTEALRALGFTKLADRITSRVAAIRIEPAQDEAGVLVVTTPYSEEAVRVMRTVPGRRWDPKAKVNRIPETSRRALHAALLFVFPGWAAVGPKGLFTIAPLPS
jgi:uncharacterized protein DUF6011